jgi:hypothetical protein
MEPGDFLVIIEDDNGVEIGRVRQSSDWELPLIGHGVLIEPYEVEDRPHLAGAYRIRDINQQPDPSEREKRGKTRRIFKIPFVYVRPDRGANAAPVATGDGSALAPVEANHDSGVPAEITLSSRKLATDLDDLADDISQRIHHGQPVDHAVVDKLNDLSREAKQVWVRTLVHSKSDNAKE